MKENKLPSGKEMLGWIIKEPDSGATGKIYSWHPKTDKFDERYFVDWFDMGTAMWSPEDIEEIEREELLYGDWGLEPPNEIPKEPEEPEKSEQPEEAEEIEERSYRTGPTGPYIDPDTGDEGQVGDLAPMILDLGSSRRGDLDESFLRMFGSGIQAILRRMFGGPVVPVTVRGTRSEIDAFSKVLQREKNYLETWSELGLDNPKTYKSKYKLDNAVRQFERKTGLTYPFK